MRAPISGVKLPAPLKYEMVLEALTSGMFSTFAENSLGFTDPSDRRKVSCVGKGLMGYLGNKIDLLPGIKKPSRSSLKVEAALTAKQMKSDTDEYLKVD
ncbi:hypothetical protein RHMOL_Rhmol04G0164500 [Rhododendron molle]|uniref:Uncharacterized protein n=1 Tax=Rhododendron molle TaxID=49168 RepID=A0ACC0P1J3_RHOML|nr:hypothetical protein RHMOL_Rhmol04G0164500 [Rhododendron molle]